LGPTWQEEASAGAVTWGELLRGNLAKRVFIGVFLQVAQQLTGVNAFLGYASTIFGNLGITDPLMFNCIFNGMSVLAARWDQCAPCMVSHSNIRALSTGVMVVGVVIGLALLDAKAGGRRKQLLGATFLMGPALLIAGLAFLFNWPGIITMVCLCIYGLGFQLAWGMHRHDFKRTPACYGSIVRGADSLRVPHGALLCRHDSVDLPVRDLLDGRARQGLLAGCLHAVHHQRCGRLHDPASDGMTRTHFACFVQSNRRACVSIDTRVDDKYANAL
jgi:hypothetical protein